MLGSVVFHRAYKLVPISVRRAISDLFSDRCSIGIVAYVIRGHQLLLLKHTKQAPWTLPCGWLKKDLGFNTSIQQTVKEETGLDIHVRSALQIFNLKGQPVIDIAVWCEAINGGLKVNYTEITEAAFFNLEKLPQEISDQHRLYIADFMKTWRVVPRSYEFNPADRKSTIQSAHPAINNRAKSSTKYLQHDHILPSERIVH